MKEIVVIKPSIEMQYLKAHKQNEKRKKIINITLLALLVLFVGFGASYSEDKLLAAIVFSGLLMIDFSIFMILLLITGDYCDYQDFCKCKSRQDFEKKLKRNIKYLI